MKEPLIDLVKEMEAVLQVKPRASVMSRRGVSSTEYRVIGPLHEVLQAIEGIFGEYPAAGYGTMVHTILLEGYTDYVARVSHSNSCD
jgi:hypothetical protein